MQVPGRASKHPSPPECQQQRQARTLTPPPLRTVEQPQACSTCRSCMAASVAEHSACAWSSPQALSTRVPEAETSAHLESASASHHGAAASLLHQSELHGGFRLQITVQVPGPGDEHSSLECRRQRSSSRTMPVASQHVFGLPEFCAHQNTGQLPTWS